MKKWMLLSVLLLAVVAVLPVAAHETQDDPAVVAQLFAAVKKGDVDMVKVLLPLLSGPDVHNEGNETPLVVAAQYARPKVVETLLEAGANVNGDKYPTPLIAVFDWTKKYKRADWRADTMETLELLLARPDIDVNKSSGPGYTALTFAMENMGYEREDSYFPELVVRLLDAPGIDVNLENTRLHAWEKPLFMAVSQGATEIVAKLVTMPGINLNQPIEEGRNDDGYNVLHTALRKSASNMHYFEIVQLLMKAGLKDVYVESAQ